MSISSVGSVGLFFLTSIMYQIKRKYEECKTYSLEYIDYMYMCYVNYKITYYPNNSNSETKNDTKPFNTTNDNKKTINILKIVKNTSDNTTDTTDTSDIDIKKLENLLHQIFHPEEYTSLNEIETDTTNTANANNNTYDENIHITYNYGNDKYKMCVKHLNLKLNTNNTNKEEPKQIIWAYLKKKDGTILEVTDIIKMYQGPSCDYHTKIHGISNKLVDIFSDTLDTHTDTLDTHTGTGTKINVYDWDHLHIENFYEEIVIDIDKDTQLNN